MKEHTAGPHTNPGCSGPGVGTFPPCQRSPVLNSAEERGPALDHSSAALCQPSPHRSLMSGHWSLRMAELPKVTCSLCPWGSGLYNLLQGLEEVCEEKATLLGGSAPVAISPRSPPKPFTCPFSTPPPLRPTAYPQPTQIHSIDGVRAAAAPGT